MQQLNINKITLYNFKEDTKMLLAELVKTFIVKICEGF